MADCHADHYARGDQLVHDCAAKEPGTSEDSDPVHGHLRSKYMMSAHVCRMRVIASPAVNRRERCRPHPLATRWRAPCHKIGRRCADRSLGCRVGHQGWDQIPLRRQPLPRAPNPITALVRSLESRREDFKRQLKQSDVLLTPPLPSAMGILDWHRHTELKEAAHSWAKDEIGRLQAEAHPALATTASDHLDLRALA